VEIYQTEEQQVEAIKSFWQQNGNAVIAGVVLGLGGFAAYGYYQDYTLTQQVATADSYLNNVEQNGKNISQFDKAGEQFIAKHGDSSYAVFTAFAIAKNAVAAKNWKQAENELNIAIAKAPNSGLKAIALVRLARVQIQQQQYAQALASLAKPMPKSFTATVEDIKGDVYRLQNKKQLALAAYQESINAGGLTTNPALQTKVDDLAEALN